MPGIDLRPVSPAHPPGVLAGSTRRTPSAPSRSKEYPKNRAANGTKVGQVISPPREPISGGQPCRHLPRPSRKRSPACSPVEQLFGESDQSGAQPPCPFSAGPWCRRGRHWCWAEHHSATGPASAGLGVRSVQHRPGGEANKHWRRSVNVSPARQQLSTDTDWRRQPAEDRRRQQTQKNRSRCAR